MDPIKLKSTAVKKTRLELLEAQAYMCAICKLPCTIDQAVLDHDHTGGHIRAVLHRGCNAAEGKILNTLRRCGIKNPAEYLISLVQYHELHTTNQTGLIHPLHFTADEKIERKKIKIKRARIRLKAAKP